MASPSFSSLWSPQHFGNNDGGVRTGMAGNWSAEPTDCNVFGTGVLTRFIDKEPCWSGLLYTNRMVQNLLDHESFDELTQPYEFSDMEAEHGNPHMWVSGHMTALPCAPLDPFFFCHHAFVDMLVERLRDTLPAGAWRYPNSMFIPWQHRWNDRMKPFDFINADGLNDDKIGKNYVYEISPHDDPCSKHSDCSTTGSLL